MNSNTTTIIIATLVIAGTAYWFFFTGTGNQPPLTANLTSTQAQVQFQTLVSQLQPITFSTNIFSDPRFAALADLTTPIQPESGGRIDPFAPVTP